MKWEYMLPGDVHYGDASFQGLVFTFLDVVASSMRIFLHDVFIVLSESDDRALVHFTPAFPLSGGHPLCTILLIVGACI